jgi:hypothetical protein
VTPSFIDPEFVREMSDDGLLRAYQATVSEEKHAEVQVLVAEIWRRELGR